MNKKVLFLPIIGSFLLCGCKIDLFGKEIYLFEDEEENKQEVIDDVIPEDPTQHATSMSQTPNAPFYLKVGEERQISVSLSPAPEKADEKICSWSLQGSSISYQVDTSNTYKAVVKGLSVGTSTLTATNTYNHSLTKSFTIKVIDFDETKDYLWQYESSDRAQFGYDKDNAKQGTLEGNAVLNGVTWHYVRSNLSSLQTSMGAIGFGKGSEPETHIHLETENARSVKNFVIEAASANSLAKMTIKVGDAVIMDEQTVPRDSWDVIQTLTANIDEPVSGKIEIDVVTPAYDPEQAIDESYRAPGAFYLKSILINFNEGMPNKDITLVKSSSDIVDGARYLIVGYAKDKAEGSKYVCLDGSLGSGVKDNPKELEDFVLNDTFEVEWDFDKYGFVASINASGKLNFTSNKNIKIGLAGGGGLSTTTSPALLDWDYTFDSTSYTLDMTMMDTEDTPKLKHFGANDSSGKFSSYASAKNNIYLYKF